jgi:hypothetical protein
LVSDCYDTIDEQREKSALRASAKTAREFETDDDEESETDNEESEAMDLPRIKFCYYTSMQALEDAIASDREALQRSQRYGLEMVGGSAEQRIQHAVEADKVRYIVVVVVVVVVAAVAAVGAVKP